MFPEPTLEALRDRALLLKMARAFFEERGILEVDCCALGPHAAIDSNIDVISAVVSVTEAGFLHTSP
jgi:elongation factor P--beta-lysine ligase